MFDMSKCAVSFNVKSNLKKCLSRKGSYNNPFAIDCAKVSKNKLKNNPEQRARFSRYFGKK
jgi:hypothetical protein